MIAKNTQAGLEQKETEKKSGGFFNRKSFPRLLEYAVAALISVIIGLLFAKHGRGGPNSSDIELYMNLGMNGLKDTFVLNRYFHIFIQQIFVELAATPLEGYHHFWGFQMGVNVFLIYFSARNLLKRSNFLHGILAVLIFFSMSAVASLSGVVVVDFTAMTMMLLVVTIYIISLKQQHANPWVVALLGFAFFLGLKTKETVLPVGILFLGLGWGEGKAFNIKKLLLNLVWGICGVFAGIVVFGILSWIILGDPFFGLRISEWQEFLGTYAVHPTSVFDTIVTDEESLSGSWYQKYWFAEVLLPFLLFIVSGIKSSEASISRKFLWLVPLFYTVFLVVTINNSLGYDSRFGLPAMPVISLLAAQVVDLKIPELKKQRRNYFVFLTVGVIIVVLIRLIMWAGMPYLGVRLAPIGKLIYYPIIFSLLLMSLTLFSKSKLAEFFNFIMILSLLLFPLASNLQDMFVDRFNERLFLQVVLPFSEFEDQIQYTSDMEFYASQSVFSRSSLKITKNVDEILSLFNIYFDARATRENFMIVEGDQNIGEDIAAVQYDYVLLTAEEWAAIESASFLDDTELVQYQANIGDGGTLILLTPEN